MRYGHRLLIGIVIGICLASGAASAEEVRLVDAVRVTLAKNPDIQLQGKQVDYSAGLLQQASGQFDLALRTVVGADTANNPLATYEQKPYASAGIRALRTDSTSYTLALDNPLRNGIVLSPSISATRSKGTLYAFNEQPPVSRGIVNFNIRVPLQKGSGDAAAATETAASQNWDASKQDLRFALSKGVVGAASSYWSLLAARKNLMVAIEAENSLGQMLREMRKLAAADEIPAADLNLIKANWIEKTTARITAEQRLLEARQSLGLVMGLPARQAAALEPADDFPATVSALPSLEHLQPALIDLAIRRRTDLAAARLREGANLTLKDAARQNLKPQVDLNLNVGYAALAEGDATARLVDALGQNRSGTNVGATLSYQWPFNNNAARGAYLQRASAYDESTIRAAELERTIYLSVQSTLADLRRSALQVGESTEAVELYRITVENEKTKHRLGSSTLVDVLSVNDRYLVARLGHIAYWLNYITAMAKLNFETGAMLVDDASGQSIRIDQLVNLPKLD